MKCDFSFTLFSLVAACVFPAASLHSFATLSMRPWCAVYTISAGPFLSLSLTEIDEMCTFAFLMAIGAMMMITERLDRSSSSGAAAAAAIGCIQDAERQRPHRHTHTCTHSLTQLFRAKHLDAAQQIIGNQLSFAIDWFARFVRNFVFVYLSSSLFTLVSRVSMGSD